MTTEATYQFAVSTGLSPKEHPMLDLPYFSQAQGVMVKDRQVVPILERMEVTPFTQVVQCGDMLFLLTEAGILVQDSSGDTLFSDEYHCKEWHYFFYGPNLVLWNTAGDYFFYNPATKVTMKNPQDIPEFTWLAHVNGQMVLCSGTSVYFAKVGTLDFNIDEQNEAGVIMLSHHISSVTQIGASLLIATDAGLYKATAQANLWGVSLYKQGAPRLLASNERHALIIEHDGTISYLWANGEGQRLDYAYIGRDVIRIEEIPYLRSWALSTNETTYLLHENFLTDVGCLVAGYGKDQLGFKLFVNHLIFKFSLLSTWHFFAQQSLKYLREVELQGNINNIHGIKLFFHTRYHHSSKTIASAFYPVLYAGTSVVNITAPHIKFGITGGLLDFTSLDGMKLRYQRADGTHIRGVDNASATNPYGPTD